MKKKFLVLIGLPCSGKSTWVENYIKKHPDTIVISSDALLMEYAVKHDLTYNEAYGKVNWKKIRKTMNARLQDVYKDDKSDVIIDVMNHRSKRRKTYFNSLPKDKYERIGILFNLEKDDLIKRNDIRSNAGEGKDISLKLWENLCSEYQTPSKDEGFDKIVRSDKFKM